MPLTRDPTSRRAEAALVAIAALACALVTACTRERGASAPLELWALGREGEIVAQMIPDFERAHPGTRVHAQQIPWSAAHEKLLTAYVGEAMPDVFQLGNTWIPEFATLGALERLDGRLAETDLRTDVFPGVFDTNVLDGATVAIPWYVDTRLLFYRSDLLATAGFTAPPPTWAAWSDSMQRAKRSDAFGVLLTLQEWQPLVVLAMQQGAGLLRDGDRYGDFRSPAFRRAFHFYVGLFRDGLAPIASQAAVANLYQEFARGTFLYYVSGPWNVGEFRARLSSDMTGKWTTAAMPAPERGGVGLSIAGGASLAVSSSSARKDAAWALVRWLCESAQQLRLYATSGDLPARRSAWDAPDGPGSDPQAAAFRAQLEHVQATPKLPEWERIAQEITRAAESVVRSRQSEDEALAELDRNVDAILAKRRWMLARTGAPR